MLSFSITHDDTTRSLRSLSRFSLWWASFFQSQDQNLLITKPQYTSPASNYTLSKPVSRCARRDLWICTRKLKLVTFLSPVVCLRKEKWVVIGEGWFVFGRHGKSNPNLMIICRGFLDLFWQLFICIYFCLTSNDWFLFRLFKVVEVIYFF